MLALTLLLVSQGLAPVDPVDLLDEADPWLRAWAERRSERVGYDGVDALLERATRLSMAGGRREAVVVTLSGNLLWRTSRLRRGISAALLVVMQIAWGAWFQGPASEALFPPREEKLRLGACRRLRVDGPGYLGERAFRERRDALGCVRGLRWAAG